MATPNLLSASSLTQGVLNTPGALANAETTVYLVPTGKAAKVATFSLCNTSGSAVTVSVSLVNSGGAAGTTNRVLSGFSLAAGDTISQEDVLASLKGAMLGEGQFISVLAGTNAVVVPVLTGTVTA